jgi:hypothetical protein
MGAELFSSDNGSSFPNALAVPGQDVGSNPLNGHQIRGNFRDCQR